MWAVDMISSMRGRSQGPIAGSARCSSMVISEAKLPRGTDSIENERPARSPVVAIYLTRFKV